MKNYADEIDAIAMLLMSVFLFLASIFGVMNVIKIARMALSYFQ